MAEQILGVPWANDSEVGIARRSLLTQRGMFSAEMDCQGD